MALRLAAGTLHATSDWLDRCDQFSLCRTACGPDHARTSDAVSAPRLWSRRS